MNQITPYLRARLQRPVDPGRNLAEDEKRAHQETVQGRLDGLVGKWRDGEISDNELIPLVGQVVRWQGPDAESIQFYIPLRKNPDWLFFGLRATPADNGCVELSCSLHEIDWLRPEQCEAIRGACRQERCERPLPVTGDAWLLDTGHGARWVDDELPEYKSLGQRDLLRAVDDLPPGEVLLGTLTTGEGKSLVTHRLVGKYPDKLVLVVVPTVALAQDQETEAHAVLPEEGLPKELAYLGGDMARDEIRERIRSGTQRLVFCNPESLRGGLMSILQACARKDGLAAVVVDEAHVVDTDGWQFRPDFLWIPSMCQSLVHAADGSSLPPRVVLLSATFTQATYDSLRRWFGSIGNQEMRVAGALRLRGEVTVVSERIQRDGVRSAVEVRKERLRRLLPLIPRPFYLYVTRPEDVEEWRSLLQQWGLTRIGCVHGGTKTEARREILRQLRSGSLDAVSANSAFGLGLNVPHVRAVLHACVPDGLDRYYQEIGRAGRDDGRALAWWLWCEGDLPIAKKQAYRKFLNKAGPGRWQAMWARGESVGEGRFWLPIGAQLLANERHEDWDVCCLVLMAGAGLIDFVWDAPRPSDKLEDALCVRLRSDVSVNTTKTWQVAVAPTRKWLQDADAGAYDCMMRVLRGQADFWLTLAEAYALRPHGASAALQPKLDRGRPYKESVRFAGWLPAGEGSSNPGTVSVVRCDGDSADKFRQHAKDLMRCTFPTAGAAGSDGNRRGVTPQRWVAGYESRHIRCLAAAIRELSREERRHLQLALWSDEDFSDCCRWVWIWSRETFSMRDVRAEVRPSASCIVFLQAAARSVHPTASIEHEVGVHEVRIDQIIQQPDPGAPF